MKQIPLTQEKFTLVDDDMFDYLNQWKWCVKKDKHLFYAVRGPERNGINKQILMHRVIMTPPKDLEVDHRNSDGLDNKRQNLRICTHSQNQQNARKRSNCTSKHKGVCWHKSYKKWRANIMIKGRNIYLGCRESEIECAQLYDKKAIELFGEFANTNFAKETLLCRKTLRIN